MKPELLQVGRDAESLARYIMEHGDMANRDVVLAQAKLLATHADDLKRSEGR